MKHNEELSGHSNHTTAAVCGLYCEACTLFIATKEDPPRLKELAARFQLSEEAIKCYGCRSAKRGPYCEKCHMFTCPACQSINSAYDLKCRNCGHEPSCAYVAKHKQAIEQFLMRL